MSRSEQKRSGIAQAAQELFFQKGYEQTSVQDILDALKLSKGGFYHYFVSKEAVLQEICEQRATARFGRLGMELYDSRVSPIDKLNRLLSLVNLFGGDDPRFAAMMMQICYVDGDVRMRDRMRGIVRERLEHFMDDVLMEGIQSGDFFVRHPGRLGCILLNLAADLDDEACRRIAAAPDSPETVIDIAEMLDACRDAVELLVGAPYGSIRLFDPARLLADSRAAAAGLRKLEAEK